MNQIKRILGIVWILLGIGAVYFLFTNQILPKLSKGGSENLIPAYIYMLILAPLLLGALGLFGKYCIEGEYDGEK